MNKKVIKCAIYTRKSSEEGLDQDFNSLDAQREACKAFIKSQMQEGWVLVDRSYNDGGYSGGTLERPALAELFKDIESGFINTVVVYKVDRLTRSLIDFSKIVELFDRHNTSFVSITQHFNTTSSMGRLTLNILLSFAQFERELTGERIRDKIAASKKKGLWVSGSAPIGYKLINKKLVVDSDNAEKVRYIFDKYLEIRSVPKLKQFLDNTNITTRTGKYFSRGNLYRILSNKTYIGKIAYKSNVYDGQHEAIIDKSIFDKTQQILSLNRNAHKSVFKSKHASLLAGKIFDDRGNYMSPSHSNTRNRRYRYYVSQAILQSRSYEAGSVSKIPAGEIETVVLNEIKSFIANTSQIHQYIEHYDLDRQKEMLLTLKTIQEILNSNSNKQLIRIILYKVVIHKDKVELHISKSNLIKSLEAIAYNKTFPDEIKSEPDDLILITSNIRISSTAKNGSVLIISETSSDETNTNDGLIHAIAKSQYWNHLLLSGRCKSVTEIQKRENLKSDAYVKKILNLKFLAPDIVEAILNGTQPSDLNVNKLCSIKTLDWHEQRELLSIK